MPSIPNSSSGSVVARTYRYVEVKPAWTSRWLLANYLTPIRAKSAVAPEVPSAQFRYDVGKIKRENRLTFQQYNPLNIRNWFVRIVTQIPGQSPTVNWVGGIVDEQLKHRQATFADGSQILTAYGLGHLLDRKQITSARVYESSEVRQISWTPTFNDRKRKGLSLKGNRSTSAESDNGNYVFSRDGEVWNNRQIIDYLLEFFSPDDITFTLTGQTDPLEQIEEVHDLSGMTVWEALNRLINRRFALGFHIEVGAQRRFTDSANININVFSLSDVPIQLGNLAVPANRNQVQFNMPTSYPHNHLADDISFDVTGTNTFDMIEVLGERVKVMATFSYEDDTLEEGWDINVNNEYRDADGSSATEAENDRFRSATKYDDLFVTHRLPKDWDWEVGDGDGGNKVSVVPQVDDNGNVTFDGSNYWNAEKRFDKLLPIEKGKNYTVDPPEDNNPDDAEPDFEAMIVIVKDEEDGAIHTASEKFHLVDKLSNSNEFLANMSVTPLDGELGFRLHASPQHYMALGHWNADGPTAKEPELDYEKLLCTAAFDTDERLRVVVRLTGREDRVRSIYIPRAEYWYAPPDKVVVGVDTDGDLQYNAVSVLRDDSELLRAVAGLARVWYGRQRQTVEIPVKNLGRFVELGSMLTSVNSAFNREQVRTVVTSRETDFENETTTLRTGYLDLDFASLAV